MFWLIVLSFLFGFCCGRFTISKKCPKCETGTLSQSANAMGTKFEFCDNCPYAHWL